ncbi:MAG: hypothetical protein AAGA18_02075 [Verrucomicrobiota bacterium]
MIQAAMTGLGLLGLTRGVTGAAMPKNTEGISPQDFARQLRDTLGGFDLPSKAEAIFSRLKEQPGVIEFFSEEQKNEITQELKGLLAEFKDHAGRMKQGVIDRVDIESGFMRFTIDGEHYDLSQLSKIVDNFKGALK